MARTRSKPVIPWSPQDPRMRFTSPEYRPYATALGQIALAWNGLHERLAFFFCGLMGGGNVAHYYAVWYAVKNDRSQRDMLMAAAKADVSGLSSYFPTLIDDITWVWKKCNDVEDARNDALHSPLISLHGEVHPNSYMGHFRAGKLAKKGDLMAELRWCRVASTVLSDYVYELDRSTTDISRPWPDRPKWPTREDTKRKKPRRRGVPKARSPPPPPSPP
jgi:hypothetical protein